MRFIALILLVGLFVHPAASQVSYPEYDGVYIFDNSSARWVELRHSELSPIGIFRSPSDADDRFSRIGIFQNIFLTHGVVMDSFVTSRSFSGELRILVRSPDYRFNFLDSLVLLNDLSQSVGIRPQPRSVVQEIGDQSDIAGQLRPIDGFYVPELVLANRGWNAQSARVRTIDQFTQEINFGELNLSNLTVQGINQNCRATCRLSVEGIAIQVVPRVPVGRRSNDFSAYGLFYLLHAEDWMR